MSFKVALPCADFKISQQTTKHPQSLFRSGHNQSSVRSTPSAPTHSIPARQRLRNPTDMALPLTVTRKRTRNANEEEASEFTPLSKRINNLHLNNSFAMPKVECDAKLEAHKELIATNERLGSLQYNDPRGVDDPSMATPQATQWSTYSPDLTPSENPFYYEPNRLLFELYQQRVERQPSGSY